MAVVAHVEPSWLVGVDDAPGIFGFVHGSSVQRFMWRRGKVATCFDVVCSWRSVVAASRQRGSSRCVKRCHVHGHTTGDGWCECLVSVRGHYCWLVVAVSSSMVSVRSRSLHENRDSRSSYPALTLWPVGWGNGAVTGDERACHRSFHDSTTSVGPLLVRVLLPVPSRPMSFMSTTHHELVGWRNRMGHVACRCRATVVGPMLLACVVPIVVILALSPSPPGAWMASPTRFIVHGCWFTWFGSPAPCRWSLTGQE